MRIISANLNKRLGNSAARKRIKTWLARLAPDLLLVQEPFVPQLQDVPLVPGYRLADRTPFVATWLSEQLAPLPLVCHSDRWQEITLPDLTLHHVYLSPHSSAERRQLPIELANRVEGDSRLVVVGDFNLAPRPEDGWFGHEYSTFTSQGERVAFGRLLNLGSLRDSTESKGEYTVERMQNGRLVRFRCDPALLGEALNGSAAVTCDHSVRRGRARFTDHSAIVLDMNGTLPQQVVNAPDRASHKTAIKRSGPSQIARELHEQGVLDELGVRSILDFGCGYGSDVDYYRSAAYYADGYDIEPKFGNNAKPQRQYDLVTGVYVIDVLSTPESRLAVVVEAAQYARLGGYVFIAARAEATITTEAIRGKWVAHNDGWISKANEADVPEGHSGDGDRAAAGGPLGCRCTACL